MATLEIQIDDRTASDLKVLGEMEGKPADSIAAKLLMRAVKLARKRPRFDKEAISKAYAGCEEDEFTLAESCIEHRAQLLRDEDEA
jgi:hypothetical protein